MIYMKNYLLTLTLILISLCTFALTGDISYGFNIATIKSREFEAYNMALEGFNSVVDADTFEYVMTGEDENDKNGIIDTIRLNSPELILAVGLDALLIVKELKEEIPIVYCMVMYPEKLALDDNKKQITGITMTVSVKKQMDQLLLMLPGLETLGLIYDPDNTWHLARQAKKISKSLGFKLITEKVHSVKAIPKAIRRLVGKIDAFWLVADATVITAESFEFLHFITIENNIPIVTYSEGLVEIGALYSLSADYFYMGELAAGLVNEIKRGEMQTFRPIVYPGIADLTINVRVGNRMSIDIPHGELKVAKKIFK